MKRTILVAALGMVFVLSEYSSAAQWAKFGLTNCDVRALASKDSFHFAGTYRNVPSMTGGGVYYSKYTDTNWVAINSGLPAVDVGSILISGSKMFAGTSSGVYLSTDNGSNWSAVNSGLPTSVAGDNVSAMLYCGTDLFAGRFKSGVFLSTNDGTSWAKSSAGMSDTNVWSLAVANNDLFAGTYYGGIFHSSNNGSNWAAANSGLTNTGVSALFASGANLFAGTWGGGVCLSTNNGSSWSARNSGLPSGSEIKAFASYGSTFFAGSPMSGVYQSSDNASNWNAIDSGLTATHVWSLLVKDTILFAACRNEIGGGGVWRLSLPRAIVRSRSRPISSFCHLSLEFHQLRNPSLSTCSFLYSLPSPMNVQLNIYDMSGHLVSPILSDFRDSGDHSILWTSRNVATGFYVASISACGVHKSIRFFLQQ